MHTLFDSVYQIPEGSEDWQDSYMRVYGVSTLLRTVFRLKRVGLSSKITLLVRTMENILIID